MSEPKKGKIKEGDKAFSSELPENLLEAIRRQAKSNRRPLRTELIEAIERQIGLQEETYIRLPAVKAERLKQLSETTGRSVEQEVHAAVDRHLASPPRVVVVQDDVPGETVYPPKPARSVLDNEAR